MGSPGAIEASQEAELAWKNCYLADLPAPLSALLLDESMVVEVEPADLMLRWGSQTNDSAIYLVLAGLVRVYLVGPEGRQATVRYATHGDVIGLPPLLVAGMNIWAEAITEVSAIRLSSRRFLALAEQHVELAWPTAQYVAQQLASTNDVLAADIFLPVRARIARHLLDLAVRHPDGLLVPASHQRLADAIGSVREVVSREMRRFAAEGLIRRVDGCTRLENPAELHRISTAPRPREDGADPRP